MPEILMTHFTVDNREEATRINQLDSFFFVGGGMLICKSTHLQTYLFLQVDMIFVSLPSLGIPPI